jgi:hypothetical protein
MMQLLIAFIFLFNQMAFAQILMPSRKLGVSREGNEYYVGQDMGQPLLTVNLMSGVHQPGVYHIPVSTDIGQLISYAGGTNDSADLSDVTIRRESSAGAKTVLNLNLERELKSSHALRELQDRDTVHIARKTGFDNSLKWVALMSGLASIALAVATIHDMDKR